MWKAGDRKSSMFLSFLDSFLDENKNDSFPFKSNVLFSLFVGNSGSQTLKLLSIFSDYSLKISMSICTSPLLLGPRKIQADMGLFSKVTLLSKA